MKSFALLPLLLAALFMAGCSTKRPDFGSVPGPSATMTMDTTNTPANAPADVSPPTSPPPQTMNPIITPDNSISATVADYNAVGRFVVLSFPVGQAPAMDETLFLYRAGLKVGEVKITGPQRDNNIVADLVSGTAQTGDEARNQ